MGQTTANQGIASGTAAVSGGETPADFEPTRPLPPVSVYTLTESGESYPAPGLRATPVDSYPPAPQEGLPAPLTVVTIEEPLPPTPEPTASPAKTVGATDSGANLAPTLTPRPTFTPPALPETSAADHYWFRRPVPQGGVVWTDKFYPYGSTRGGGLRTHHGVEFNVGYDTPILAAADGVVVHAGADDQTMIGPELNFYGIVVVLQHDFTLDGRPIFTLYGHLNGVSVAEGQRVRAQEQIGLSGATGVADGPHLHFEVRVGENTYAATRNPLLWLWPFPNRGTVAGRVVFPGGQPARSAPVNIRRVDGGDPTVSAAVTYADDGVNGDDTWQENFVLDDVEAGYYEVYVKVGEKKYSQEIWVFPRRTAFTEIVLDE